MSKPIPAHSLAEYQPVAAFLNENSQFSENQVSWLLRFRDENGLAMHVTKIGRSLYIHVPGFLRWVNESRNAA